MLQNPVLCSVLTHEPCLQVTQPEINDLFRRPDATLTLFMPPRINANGLIHSFQTGDMTAEAVRDVVLTHCIPQKLSFQDLVALPADTSVPTLLQGTTLQPSQAETGTVKPVTVLQADLHVCAENAIVHTIKEFMIPVGIQIPDSAAARSLDGGDDFLQSLWKDYGEYALPGGVAAVALSALLGLLACHCCGDCKRRRQDPYIHAQQYAQRHEQYRPDASVHPAYWKPNAAREGSAHFQPQYQSEYDDSEDLPSHAPGIPRTSKDGRNGQPLKEDMPSNSRRQQHFDTQDSEEISHQRGRGNTGAHGRSEVPGMHTGSRRAAPYISNRGWHDDTDAF